MIFHRAYARELTCLLLDACCCHLLPVQNVANLTTLRDALSKFLEEEKICQTITDMVTEAHRRTDNDALKELLSPALMKSNLDLLFIAPQESIAKK